MITYYYINDFRLSLGGGETFEFRAENGVDNGAGCVQLTRVTPVDNWSSVLS